jgi:hypothetical protein
VYDRLLKIRKMIEHGAFIDSVMECWIWLASVAYMREEFL